ncbi:Ral GTPase-activating protein subunit alpha-2 [Chelonia mydas]|uniref:Ral GTPase-activating protein subunit alpha-2 n=1 Tax=Chelonia mydas TaxID=8469 RepID=M7B687_CHEMY|nr:Ral GTPase-activating protein subunit alpha-2 [Chelonia mydas]
MFSRRSHADVKKSTQKALDPKKDVLTRLKHLKALLDIVEGSDLKQFFEINYSQIYFIFYENFITLENSLKQKGNKSQREELDSILFLFERCESSLPALCRDYPAMLKYCCGQRFNIASEDMPYKTSLSPCGYQQLQATVGFQEISTSVGVGLSYCSSLSQASKATDAQTEGHVVRSHCPGSKREVKRGSVLKKLLHTGNSIKIRREGIRLFLLWLQALQTNSTEEQVLIFACLVPGFPAIMSSRGPCTLDTLISPTPNLPDDIPDLRPKPAYITATRNNENIYSTKIPFMAARVVFIKWLVTFFLEKKYLTSEQNTKNGGEMLPKIIQTVGGTTQDKNPELETSVLSEQEKNHSNSSTLSDRRLSNSSLCSIEEQHRTVYEMVQRILLSTRGYVNFVNEVFRQLASGHSGHKRSSSWGRTYSFSNAVSRGCVLEDEDKNVKAGAQAALQVFLTNSANVFLLEPCAEVPALLKEQVDACKAVLSIFRHMIMELSMNKKTWEQMLQILLRITEGVMQKPKDNQVKDMFAQSLAGLLFRTLIVAWIRANLSVYISRELWDELLSILSSLTDWEELITEWANIMDSLTVVLARMVYGVEMTNLPLDKLSEQKEKKQRGKGGISDPQKTTTMGRSFSLSWRSHPEVAEPMRFRSATTSGAPGIEKARNIVRQRATEVEEAQQSENTTGPESSGLFADQDQQLTRSSSTSDIIDQFSSDFFQDKKTESSQNLNCVDSKSIQDKKGYMKKENEAQHVLIRRSSSPAELDLKADLQQSHGNHREREMSESVSSDTFIGYNNEVEITLVPWQTCEEEHEVNIPTDVCVDADARHWLQLSPSDAANLTDSSEFLADDCSIIAGGNLIGWHPDSAAVLWRRILGILGDVNNIQSPKIHAKVFGYLYELWYKLAKIRDNLAISLDNQSTPSPPVLIPPLRIFAAWLFKATTLPNEYKEGKLQAYRLICAMMTRRQDVLPNSDFLVHFYLVMHIGLTSEDQDILNTVIKHCPSCFFFLGLPGFTMLIGDFITAAARILSTDMLEAPRSEAHTILGSLVCFPNIYQEIPLLQPISEADEIIAGDADVKCYLINILLKNATDEPSETARKLEILRKEDILFKLITESLFPFFFKRCIAVCCLGVWICEELVQCTNHPQVRDAINVIGVTLKVLHCCVYGSSTYTQQSHYILSLADLSSNDYDPFLPLGNVKNSEPAHSHSIPDLGNLLTVVEEKKRRSLELIPLTARMVMTHLVNHLSHYPLSGGPAILHSLISENHDNFYVESSELSSEVFRSPNLQLFVFNDSTLISYLQIPAETTVDTEPAGVLSDVRVIVRDISGKYSWDGTILYGPLEGCLARQTGNNSFVVLGSHEGQFEAQTDFSQTEEGDDALNELLEKIGNTSPECLLHPQLKLNEPSPPPFGMSHDQENEIIEAIIRQSAQEKDHVRKCSSDLDMNIASEEEPSSAEPQAPFYFCRLLLNDLGMNSWDRSRETHKIAVFYIAEGQEDKCSILSNARGSQPYEDFVAGLGWEVDLSTHCGFMGGLQRNGSTGQTAPYYATSTVEVIFHVSTRMPSDSDDSLTKKLRHLGNDEVHIVWSEHTRNYRRGIIPTDFGDVLIIIYPMKNHMFFVEIMKKPEMHEDILNNETKSRLQKRTKNAMQTLHTTHTARDILWVPWDTDASLDCS